jgi:hypothetical protein
MSPDALRYLLPAEPAVLFPLSEPLGRSTFFSLLDVLARHGEPVTGASADAHWEELERRRAGAARWDRIAPPPAPDLQPGSTEFIRASNDAQMYVPNLLARRPYRGYRIGPFTGVTIDWFNPADEFELGYAGAGEPVLALLLSSWGKPGLIQDQLSTVTQFYDLLSDVDGTLASREIHGAASFGAPFMFYAGGNVPATVSPWSFLYPLSVIERVPACPSDAELAKAFAVVRPWSRNRILLQPLPGLSLRIASEFPTCASLVGRTAVQETIPGAYGRKGSKPKASRRPS